MARSQSQLINVLRQNDTRTEKGMLTNSTSLNGCVDMFFMAGAARHWTKEQKINLFQKALTEDPQTALRLLFWSRDVRGGAGERQFFRDCLTLLNDNYPEYLIKISEFIPEFGRWDDLFFTDPIVYLPLIKKGLDERNALLAKWMPRKNQYNNLSKNVREYLEISPKEYRKLIVELSNTIEQKMCDNKFDEINYEHVPSVAMNRYRKSFYRNDETRFSEYIDMVNSGEKKMNAGVLYPHQIYQALMKQGRADKGTFKINQNDAIEAMWKSLPNYMEGTTHRILPMVDVSPSMTWYGGLPLDVSISLGIYISERNESIFKDAFMTFSENPTIEFLKGTFVERATQLRYSKWGKTTNLEKAFDVLLTKSLEHSISDEYMPTILLIISDMQFDLSSSRKSALDMIKEKYEENGYKLPHIFFWNVRSKEDCVPADDNQQGVGLISGFSPSILKNTLNGVIDRKPTPYETMMSVVNSGRYDMITI